MKKILLLLTSLFISILSFGQFSMTINDEAASDGDEFSFFTTGGSESEIEFVLTNESEADIKVVCTVESVTNNADGDNTQFCWEVCYTSPVVAGNQYHPPSGPQLLTPGSSTAPHGNHFVNLDTGDDPDSPVIYVFKFHEVNDDGDEIGDPITVTYIYDITLALEDIDNVSYKLYPSVTDESFTIEVDEDITGVIINSNGQIVKEFIAKSGSNTVDVSNLTSQLYYVVLTNKKAQKSLSKLLIK